MSRPSSAASANDNGHGPKKKDKKAIMRNNSYSPPPLAITGSPPSDLNGGNLKKPRYLHPSPETATHHKMPPPQRNCSGSPTLPGNRPAAPPGPGGYPYPAMPPNGTPRDYPPEYPYPERPHHYPPYPRHSSMPYPYFPRGPTFNYHYATPIKPNNKKRSLNEAMTPPRGSVDPRFSSSPSASHESGKTSCETNTTCSSNESFVTSPRHMKESSQHYPHHPGEQYPPPVDPNYYYHHYYQNMHEHHRAMSQGPTMDPHHMPPYPMHHQYPGMPYYPPVPHNYYGSMPADNNEINSRSRYPKNFSQQHSRHTPVSGHHYGRSFTPAHSVGSSNADDENKPPSERMSDEGEPTTSYSRKDRALGLLCERFLKRCCYRSDRDFISIDEAARTLSVEKRRIYDIINILEAIHIVSRKCKDTYFWHGTAHLPITFAKLQRHALSIWKEDGIEHGLIPGDNDIENNNQENSSNASDLKSEPCGIQMLLESANAATSSKGDKTQCSEGVIPPKEKSLARLCRCFIQLFLVGNDVISLNDACDKILQIQEDEESNRKKEGSIKTKVRRLYDVANVMVSLGIVVKVGNPKNGNPKNSRPIFKWTYSMSPKEMKRLYYKAEPAQEN